MRLLVSLLLLCPVSVLAGWPELLESAGVDPASVTIIEGNQPAYGFAAQGKRVNVRSVVDLLQPKLQIVWQQPVDVPVYNIPSQARVFAKEKRSNAPLVAGYVHQGKPLLWTATSIGEKGFERYPYLIQALGTLGAAPKYEARHLWAFFDSSYRLRADVDFLARQWRRGGIAALHIAAWHYWEPDKQRDRWLADLITACHRNAILVYAWVEFPHVSEQFWQDHPEWREKTATLQDAHLDWRKLMNLSNPDCAREIATGLDGLIGRFDWDGVNLGELYFESLEGAANPTRFTPFSDDARRAFRAATGQDLLAAMRRLNQPEVAAQVARFRTGLAHDLQREWLQRLVSLRQSKPYLELVLTHIDDRFDRSMREKLGADAERALKLAEELDVTFLVEDPATVWHLGPERYPEIARRYAPISSRHDLLAIDLNIVERYQDVYPTKQQTGGELLQLVRKASESFGRVALYFENSITPLDWPWLAAASAVNNGKPRVLRGPGCARVNGAQWPAGGKGYIILPPGDVKLETCELGPTPPIADFNGTLLNAGWADRKVWIEYESRSRAIAVLADGRTVMLPPGKRRVEIAWNPMTALP